MWSDRQQDKTSGAGDSRRGFTAMIDSLVVAQLPLPLMRDQTKNAQVAVGHDRARPGSVDAIETTVA
jgi:hypothetical protein